MYIIDEFIIIFETLESNNKIDLNLLNNISETLRDNSAIIQKYEENFSDELIEKYKKIYELITKNLTYTNKNYYSLLKNLFFKEIKKIKDVDYRTAIFADLIKENEVIKDCNDIFQIILKDLIKPTKINFLKAIQNLLDNQSEMILIMESVLCNKKENNYFTLIEILLYFFKKNSIIYLNKILNEYIVTKDKKEEKEKYTLDEESEPLKVFKNCINNLDEYNELSLYICSSFKLIFSASSLDILYKYCSEIKFNTPLNSSSFFKEYTSFFGLDSKPFSNTGYFSLFFNFNNSNK